MATLEEIAAKRGTKAPLSGVGPEQGPVLPSVDNTNRLDQLRLAQSNPQLYAATIGKENLGKADKRQQQYEAGLLNFGQGFSGMVLDDMLALADASGSYVLPQNNIPGLAGRNLDEMSFTDRQEALSDYYNDMFDQTMDEEPLVSFGAQVAGGILGLPGKAAQKAYGFMNPQGPLGKVGAALGIGALEGGALGAAEGSRGVDILKDMATGGALGGAMVPGAAIGSYIGGKTGAAVRDKLKGLFSREGFPELRPDALKGTQTDDFISQSPEAVDVAAGNIGRMNVSDPVQQRQLAELREVLQDDIVTSQTNLRQTYDNIMDVESATQRAARLQHDLSLAKTDYDAFIASHGDDAIPQGDLVRALNYAFQPKGQTTVLSTTAQAVRDKWWSQINDMAARSPNQAIPVKTLLDMRKDISSLLSADNAAEIGSAYPKLTGAIENIDDLINTRTNDMYKVVNGQYKDAYKRQEAYDLGRAMASSKHTGNDAAEWLANNPALGDEFKAGLRSQLASNNTAITASLRNLLGDPDNPLRVAPGRIDKLSAAIGAKEAAALRQVYETHGPRLDALQLLDDVTKQRLLKPNQDILDAQQLADRMAVQHSILTSGPGGAISSMGLAGATARQLAGRGDKLTDPRTTTAAIDLLKARGGPYREQAAETFGQQSLMPMAVTAGTTGGIATANAPALQEEGEQQLDSLMGGLGGLLGGQ